MTAFFSDAVRRRSVWFVATSECDCHPHTCQVPGTTVTIERLAGRTEAQRRAFELIDVPIPQQVEVLHHGHNFRLTVTNPAINPYSNCDLASEGRRRRSEADEKEEILKASEVAGISSVESESIGVGGRGDEQVCDATPVRNRTVRWSVLDLGELVANQISRDLLLTRLAR
jgi:hypothetical protein